MGISNVPFPSFTLVLTSDHVIIPGRSMVIRIEPLLIKDNLMVGLLLRTCRTCEYKSFLLKKTVDLHNPQSENLSVSLENNCVSLDFRLYL